MLSILEPRLFFPDRTELLELLKYVQFPDQATSSN